VKKVVVLGGAGAMGQVIVKDLAACSQLDNVTIADFNLDKAEELKKSIQSKNVTAAFADLKDKKSLLSVLEGAAIVINSTPYYFNLDVMEAALEASCHYMDLGGLFHVTKKQLQLNDRFKEKNLLAVLGMGAAPGMTNVMARSGADELDSVKSIDIIIGCVDFVKVDHPLNPPYALDTILDEYTKEPMVFEAGQYMARPPMSGEITVDFPEPVGTAPAILTLHSEVLTLPETFKDKGVQDVTFRLGLPTEFHERLKFLVDLGFGKSEPLYKDDPNSAPRKVLAKMLEQFPVPQQDPNDCEVVRVDVQGLKDGKKQLVRMEAIVYADKKWKISCGALDTGVPPSIVAQMIVQNKIAKRGVLAPEVCVPEQAFYDELSKRNIKVTKVMRAADATAAAARA